MNTLVINRNRSKISRELTAVVTIAARDITLAIKTPGMIIFTLAMPLVMMGLLGGSLSQNMAGGLGFNYKQYMMVGVLVNQLFMMMTTGITSLIQDRAQDFTQELFVSPISRYSIVIGKIIGAAFMAMLQLIGVFIISLVMGISISFNQLTILIGVSPLICLAAGALGMVIVAFIKSDRMANIVVMLIVMPQMFLSGAIIPINHSSGVLFVLSRVMPMTYCLDLVRAVFYTGTSEYSRIVLFNPFINLLVIIALTVVFLIIGTFFFARSETKR
jgi:ABC-2 type transport system permease protein